MKAAVLAGLAALALAGCDVSMTDQPRLDTYGSSDIWPDGAAARRPPAGTVSQSDPAWEKAMKRPPAVTTALIERGHERYDIYCAPCHGASGHGDGMVVRRGFPSPPSYHSARLRAAPAQHFFDVITNGYGVMYSYASRVPPRDRWAIVAYIRALQLSQHASLADVPDAREQLP
ncbi:MAG: c-type cytochrome [Alphaproteobacteria bacterium]|nr:c-type cytochrome [Alphaproteobacteria bacterium]